MSWPIAAGSFPTTVLAGKLKNIPMPVWGRELCLQATFSTKTTEQGWIGMNPWRWLSAPLTQLSAMTARRLCRDLICRVDSHGVTRMPTEEVAVLTKRLVDQVTAESDREEAQ